MNLKDFLIKYKYEILVYFLICFFMFFTFNQMFKTIEIVQKMNTDPCSLCERKGYSCIYSPFNISANLKNNIPNNIIHSSS